MGTLDYQGDDRFDRTYSIEGDVIYKLTRNLWIKGTLRRDILNSTSRRKLGVDGGDAGREGADELHGRLRDPIRASTTRNLDRCADAVLTRAAALPRQVVVPIRN